MKNNWIRTSGTTWEQYVGRRVLLHKNNYLAHVGNVFCGKWATLDEAQKAAEQKQ